MNYTELVKSLRICGEWKAEVRIPSEPSECDGCAYYDAEKDECKSWDEPWRKEHLLLDAADAIEELSKRPEIPETGIGDLSDGYHTFNGLYYQRMVLFAALVKAYKDKAWKSWKHEDEEPCFGGGWFIVGIDTPQGSYTYHYEDKYWNWFECGELQVAKHWDGHTEADVTRLLSLPEPPKEETE